MGDFQRIYKTDLSDRQLMAFWKLVQASGRDRSIGFDRPAMDGPAFCRFLRRPGIHPWLIAWRGSPMALYWLSDFQGRSAHIHFCMLPCGTRRRYTWITFDRHRGSDYPWSYGNLYCFEAMI